MKNSEKVLTDSKIDLTDDVIMQREKTADHVKALIKKENYTVQMLADLVGASPATIRNYTHGRTSMSADIAKLFETKVGYIHPYWTGETDAKTWIEYQAELDRAEAIGAEEYYAAEQKEEELLTALFSRCGYRFENLSNMSGFDFTPDAKWPNRITALDDSEMVACFDDKELNGIIEKMHDIIALECFRKNRMLESK